MSCTGTTDCLCGCCAGTSVQTPQVETNLPGQPSVSYRAGTWATFKESMLARLSSSDYPALARLKTRDDDDFSIAFLDATAVVLDILTFYQERLANESYLGTATQSRSLTELSRLIGYQPSPGVSSSVYVAFTLKAAPGQPPDPTAPAITIPAGTQVQSVPAQGQKPQIFEISSDIPAKPDWSALAVQTTAPWQPGAGKRFIYLQGTSTQLNPGDSLLILGVNRETWALHPTSTPPPRDWEVVVLNQVVADNVRKITYVAWDQPLTHVLGRRNPRGLDSRESFRLSSKGRSLRKQRARPEPLCERHEHSLKTNYKSSRLPRRHHHRAMAMGEFPDCDQQPNRFGFDLSQGCRRKLVRPDSENAR